MAAYGALLSLMHIIDQIQSHPCPPITLNETQAQSLTENVAFLQNFLEDYSFLGRETVDELQSRIRDAAYAAEDTIESHVVDRVLAQSADMSAVDLHEDLQRVIEDMGSIRKEAVQFVQDKVRVHGYQEVRESWRSQPTGQSTITVGFEEELYKMLDMVTRGAKPTVQIIPIVGMGGIGKTTLARNVYMNPLIEEHFDVCSWVTVSQEYDIKEILLEIIARQMGEREPGAQLNKRYSIIKEILLQILENKGNFGRMGEQELGEMLYKSLFDSRYLIVMDDMWSTELWEKMKSYLPDNSNGSRIIVTTRSSKVAGDLSGTSGIQMKFLDKDKSWYLLSRIVFGEEHCPPELERIGRKIAEKCKGLPWAITVIGGLLAKKSNWTQQYWEYIVEEVSSMVNLEEENGVIKIIQSSYSLLPIHLKPCFLHLGIFPEDSEIHVSELLNMWVAEGFLKPITGRSLEEVAEEYLKDLIQRNLILVRKRGFSGEIKTCTIHDLLRDLCRREAYREKFVSISSQHRLDDPHDEGIKNQRRIAIEGTLMKVENFSKVTLQLTSRVRSLVCNSDEMVPSDHFRLLRVLKADHTRYQPMEDYSLDDLFQLVNSRHLHITTGWNNPAVITGWGEGSKRSFPSSLSRLWNLQTLTVKGWYGHVVVAPPEIWNMYSLRHISFEELYLPDPPGNHTEKKDCFVLKNLQTLMKVINFKCSREALQRIPNVKKLKLSYMDIDDDEPELEVASHYCLSNLVYLHKLESLSCVFAFKSPSRDDFMQNVTFSYSLKKLTLYGTGLHWDDMSMIGSLPNLEELKLKYKSFIGAEWEPIEGEFLKLKHLLLSFCNDLEYWRAEEGHFPRLERLVLENLLKLREIPPGIGDIPTLQSIQLKSCSVSAILSAKQIVEEQWDFGNEDLHARVLSVKKDPLLKSLESDNFEVITSCDVKHEPIEYKSEEALQA